jgi:1-acyl-sn-glycerol-3-phosphate acyltransferase
VFVFKTKTYYEDNKKPDKDVKGSFIIISNHRSVFDGMVIALKFFSKRLHFLATDFYGNKRKILKFLVIVAGGIFVSEDGRSFGFISKSERIAARGRPILMFPEGGFKFTYEPAKFSAGYIALAVKLGVRIVPVVNDLNYGLFRRVHILIGNSIDLSDYSGEKLTSAKLNEINDEIRNKYMLLFYKLKRKKAERISNKYAFISPKAGDVVRIHCGTHYHYGVYLNVNEVIQFGRAVNEAGENIVVNSVCLKEFCGAKIFEVRTLKKSESRFKRNADEIEKYAKSCIGQTGYSIANNNCLDFANRITLKI